MVCKSISISWAVLIFLYKEDRNQDLISSFPVSRASNKEASKGLGPGLALLLLVSQKVTPFSSPSHQPPSLPPISVPRRVSHTARGDHIFQCRHREPGLSVVVFSKCFYWFNAKSASAYFLGIPQQAPKGSPSSDVFWAKGISVYVGFLAPTLSLHLPCTSRLGTQPWSPSVCANASGTWGPA